MPVNAYIESWSCEISNGTAVVTEWMEDKGRYATIVHIEVVSDIPKDPYKASDFAHSFLKNWVKKKKREEQINKILGK